MKQSLEKAKTCREFQRRKSLSSAIEENSKKSVLRVIAEADGLLDSCTGFSNAAGNAAAGLWEEAANHLHNCLRGRIPEKMHGQTHHHVFTAINTLFTKTFVKILNLFDLETENLSVL